MRNILVIEDDQNIRESISELLEMKNYQTRVAKNGQEGVDSAVKNKPDLILCDIMMPGISGYEVLNKIRKSEGLATIPFIFLTAKSQKSDMREGMNLGADDYLTKPFQAKELFEAVESRLKRKEAEQKEKVAALEPLRKRIIQQGIYDPLKGILDSSELLLNYFENYSQEEIISFVKKVNTSVHKLDRSVRNVILHQSIELATHDTVLKSSLAQGITRVDDEFIRPLVVEIGEVTKRSADIFIRKIEPSRIAMPIDSFRVVLKEALYNAFDYSTNGQLVTLEAGTVGDYYEVKIEDRGVGMSWEKLENLGQEPNVSLKGMGLGLYLIKQLSGLTGGDVTVKSEKGNGTTVIIKIKTDI